MTATPLAPLPDAPTGDGVATILHLVGGPSSFLRIAPVVAALAGHDAVRQILVHTGVPADSAALGSVLAELGVRPPDRCLGVVAGTSAARTGAVLVELERVLAETQPALVVVAGGLDATLGSALAACKRGVPIVNVDAGLRSFDWSTSDEINRVLTDRLAQTLLTSCAEAGDNLLSEGVGAHRVHHVGNTLVDVVRRCEPRARALRAWDRFGVPERRYVLVSLHRPEHAEAPQRFQAIATAVAGVAKRAPVVLSLDAQTRAQIAASGTLAELQGAGVQCIDRLDYLDFLSLQAGAGAVVTDAGAIQDETSALGVACFTLRVATERSITLTQGTNALLGDEDVIDLTMVRPMPLAPCTVGLWDGHAADRAARVVAAHEALEPVVHA
ncbi:MAG: UDP-N-acetyl glucosamine 2-epimerase [Conexibacter sp.]|nr:UDP-N-acetyl glucosamine 2-epimerase [Conexibacter sp.]